MSRTTYIMRNGQLVEKRYAAQLESHKNGPMVISDEMDPMWHPANGHIYDSKSRFRAETRARGLTEVGNERQRDIRQPFDGSARDDVRQAVEMVRQGYRPNVMGEGEI